MLKILVVLLPMVAGATLAGAARAATPIDINSQPVAVSVQSGFAAVSGDSVRGFHDQQAATLSRAADVETIGRNTSRLPEPTSWAIMLTGFGLIGGAARLRRAHRVA